MQRKGTRIQNYIYQTVRGKDKVSLMKDASTIPVISTGTAAPTTTPTKVGDMYIDTTNKKLYFSVGTSASTDWIIAN